MIINASLRGRSRNKSCGLQKYNYHFLSANLERNTPAPNTCPSDWDQLPKHTKRQSLFLTFLDFSECQVLQSLKALANGSRTEVRAPHRAAHPFPWSALSTSETPTDPGHCEGPAADGLDSLYFLRHLLSGVGGDGPLKVKGTVRRLEDNHTGSWGCLQRDEQGHCLSSCVFEAIHHLSYAL